MQLSSEDIFVLKKKSYGLIAVLAFSPSAIHTAIKCCVNGCIS